jgi:hypothetical protein
MDELKLAFETVIVGLLAIPWLLILFHLGSNILGRKSLLTKASEFLKDGHQSFALMGPLIIGLAYCAGTVLFPFADDYFNDPHRFPVHVRGDDAIRVDTLTSLYFKHKYYNLNPNDFVRLANAEDEIKKIDELGPKAVKREKDTNLEDVYKGLCKDLKDPTHSIYNYQKFYDYNSSKGYEVLKPLSSRIIVLRGAVLNGLLLLGALLLLFLVDVLKVILRRSKEGIQRPVLLLLMGFVVWVICWWGAWGVAKAEEEYDKHVVGIFYGSIAGTAINKMLEQPSEGGNTEPQKEK